MLAVAAVFGLFALALFHVAAFDALEGPAGIAPVWAALIVLGGDALLAVIFLAIGRSGAADPRTVEARIVRDRALNELRSGFALAAITGPAGRMAGRGAAGLLRSILSRRRKPRVR